MAQLKSTLIQGNLSVVNDINCNGNIFSTGTLELNKINAPTTSNGATYGAGSNGQILRSNGTTCYWDNETNPMTTAGDIIYGGSNGVQTRLAPGASNQVLTSGSTPSWSNIIDLIYPVGSIYMSMNIDSTTISDTNKQGCPIANIGGKWNRVSQGRMLLGAGNAPEDNNLTYNVSATGGSKNAAVISHTHNSGSTGSSGSNISINETNLSWWFDIMNCYWESYTTDRNSSGVSRSDVSGSAEDTLGTEPRDRPLRRISYNKNHGHGITDNQHSHSIAWEGVDGTNRNMPPYLTVYIWQRVAD